MLSNANLNFIEDVPSFVGSKTKRITHMIKKFKAKSLSEDIVLTNKVTTIMSDIDSLVTTFNSQVSNINQTISNLSGTVVSLDGVVGGVVSDLTNLTIDYGSTVNDLSNLSIAYGGTASTVDTLDSDNTAFHNMLDYNLKFYQTISPTGINTPTLCNTVDLNGKVTGYHNRHMYIVPTTSVTHPNCIASVSQVSGLNKMLCYPGTYRYSLMGYLIKYFEYDAYTVDGSAFTYIKNAYTDAGAVGNTHHVSFSFDISQPSYVTVLFGPPDWHSAPANTAGNLTTCLERIA